MINRWIDFKYSNPLEFDSNEFIFLVHALQLGSPVSINGRQMDRKYGIGYKIFRDLKNIHKSTEPDYDLVESPFDVAKMTIIDCSLIGRGKYQEKSFEQLNTWNPVGLILSVPVENILISGKEDLNTDFITPEEEIQRYVDTDKGDPWDLLLNGIDTYNHVVVKGKSDKIKVIGIFDNEWALRDSPQAFKNFYKQWAEKISQSANLPLLTIPDQKVLLQSTISEIEKE